MDWFNQESDFDERLVQSLNQLISNFGPMD